MGPPSTALSASSPITRLATAERFREIRELRSAPLLDFVTRTTKHFERPEHLAKLAELLDRSRTEEVRAVVSVPPQHGKSQLLLHHLVRLVATRPRLQSAYVGYGIEFARDQAALAEIIEREASPRVPFQRQTTSAWSTGAGGGIYWTGIGGPLTGRKVDGILAVDDPYKNRLEAESPLHQRRVMDWWHAVALPRVNPGASIIVIQARWTDTDLAGQLIADGGWEVVELPAILEDGTPLWPSQRPLEFLREIEEKIGPYDWSSLYLGRPRPRGDRLMRGVYTYTSSELPEVPTVAGIDLAYTTSARNDRSVAVEAQIDDGVIYLVGAVLGHFEVEPFADRLTGLRAEQFLFEPGPSEQTLVRLLNDHLARADSPSRIVATQPRTVDKFTASQPLLTLWNAGRVRLPDPDSEHHGPWVEEIIRECLAFTGTGAGPDDVVDALIPLARFPDLDRRLFRPEEVRRVFEREVETWDLSRSG